MPDDVNIRKIFDGMFRPLFERQPELSISDLLRCFPGCGIDTLTSFMADFIRLELITRADPFRWKLLRRDN